MGRFMSPDFNGADDYTSPVPYADLSNPQSLNLYSYVGNNPLTNTDPDGHDCIYANGGSAYVKSGDCFSDTDPGTYVNGTVTSANYSASNNSIGFTYTNADNGNLGAGVSANVPGPQPMDEGAVTPGDNGLGFIVGGMATDYAIGRVLGSIFGRGAGEIVGAGAGKAASVDVTNLSAKIVKDMARRGWTGGWGGWPRSATVPQDRMLHVSLLKHGFRHRLRHSHLLCASVLT
jgi:hypothetical protein